MKQKQTIKRVIFISLILAIFFSALPISLETAAAASTGSCKYFHRIAGYDTLNKIAKKYNVRFQDLASANLLESPYAIYLGEYLCIPSTARKYQLTQIPSQANLPPGDFTVVLKYNMIHITYKNFQKKMSYYVKVSKPEVASKSMTKIGLLKTNVAKSGTQKFALSKPLRSIWPMKVCIKDVYSRANICRSVIK